MLFTANQRVFLAGCEEPMHTVMPHDVMCTSVGTPLAVRYRMLDSMGLWSDPADALVFLRGTANKSFQARRLQYCTSLAVALKTHLCHKKWASPLAGGRTCKGERAEKTNRDPQDALFLPGKRGPRWR